MKLKLTITALFAANALILATPAMAATQIFDDNGVLTGATGVVVGSNTYDVSFADGTCASVYGACQQSYFDFTTSADAQLAAQALLDQVLLNTTRSFDDIPAITFGCSSTSMCSSFVAYDTTTVAGTTTISGARAVNRSSASGVSDSTALTTLGLSNTTTAVINQNWARFTVVEPTSSVPELTTWAMMLIGFGAIGGRFATSPDNPGLRLTSADAANTKWQPRPRR